MRNMRGRKAGVAAWLDILLPVLAAIVLIPLFIEASGGFGYGFSAWAG